MSTVTCATCGTGNPAGQKFCGECGSALLRSRPRPDGPYQERRLVTILFADLAGSTALGETLDPDELYELVDGVHRQLEACVVRYGGHVARHLGDGMMALFGAPTAHENDAERAVLAGLDMQRTLAGPNIELHDGLPPLEMRVGITSGEVVAGAMTGIYDVMGDAPNVAARLQGAAPEGGVLVGEETMRLARRRIRFGNRQELALKGKAEPVAAYEALGLREQLGERWEQEKAAPGGYATPLVGRGQELEQLLAAWERARAGEGQLLALVGDPGVGKSRLVAEAIDRMIGDATDAVSVLRGRCLSYGQSVSLWLVADLVRSLSAVPEEAGPDAVRDRITSTVESVLAACDETDRAIARDVLGEVLGLAPSPSLVTNAGSQVRRSSLIRMLGLVLSSLAERGLSILVLEDLHWLDTASQEILTEVLLDVPGRRTLVLGTQRSGWPPWSEWSWIERLTLHPLPENEASVLAGSVLGGMPLSAELEAHVRDRAGGNPFFVEELLRFLQESGGLEQRDGRMGLAAGRAEKLPSSLTEVLLARLDRLESQVRGVAQVGSVIGRSFAVRLLARVMEREEAALTGPLRSLEQAEIAFPLGSADPAYVFKHATVRDVAYGMLVRKRQRQLHLAVARAIAAFHPTDEYVELIAYHFARTEEDAEAAGWLEKAGDRARETHAIEAAIEHYQAALERLERSAGDASIRARVEMNLGNVLYRATRYEEAAELQERAVRRYRAEGDLEGAGRAMARLGWTLVYAGKLEEARWKLEEMAELLAAIGPSRAAVLLQETLAVVFQFQGRYREMLAAADRTVEVARAVGDEELRGCGEERRGTALALLGRLEESQEALEEAIPLLEEKGNLVDLGVALSNLGETRRLAGDLAEAVRLIERGLELATRARFVNMEVACHVSVADLLTITGEWGQARERVARAEETAAARSIAAWVAPLVPLQQGVLALREGNWEAARRLLDRAVELAALSNPEVLEAMQSLLGELAILEGRSAEARDRLQGLVDEEGARLPHLLLLLGWAHLELGETRRALELAKRSERDARERRALLYLPEALRIKGVALARLGKNEEAAKALLEGRDRAHTLPNPYIEARILVELGLLDLAEGDRDGGRERLEKALTIFQRLGASKDIERAEQELAELDRSSELTR